ncbi:hypothetical protein [Streptomyces sp. NPDC007369]|uniref:hypothetical protein n=1 Tax=Streptomyces sp. NPDC007369 TaxID=3154589 RepID=UPI0033EC93CD
MSDPLNLTVLGAGLPAAFTYLFQHLDRLVERRRARRRSTEAELPAELPIELPACLDGDPGELTPDPAVMDELGERLDALYGRLAFYSLDPGRLDPEDPQLADELGELRSLLEAVYRTRLTFRGEPREATGVRVDVKAIDIQGKVGGVVVQGQMPDVELDSKVHAERVGDKGQVIGIEIDTTGSGGR